jgi:hypothetical protein
MPERKSIRNVKETIRLMFELGLEIRQIVPSCSIPHGSDVHQKQMCRF